MTRDALRSRVVLACTLLLLGAVLAAFAPHVHPRHEERHTGVDITLPSRIDRRPWTMEIRVRSEHERRRRVFVRGLDLAGSLVPGATVVDEQQRPATVLPFSGAHRLDVREEVSPERARILTVQVRDLAPGRYRGAVDVLLDASLWVRREVEFEVLDAGP